MLDLRAPRRSNDRDITRPGKAMFGKTISTKTAEIEKKWVVIDGTGLVVGRLASLIAMRLRGSGERPPPGLVSIRYR